MSKARSPRDVSSTTVGTSTLRSISLTCALTTSAYQPAILNLAAAAVQTLRGRRARHPYACRLSVLTLLLLKSLVEEMTVRRVP